jgi:hypothetical protein
LCTSDLRAFSFTILDYFFQFFDLFLFEFWFQMLRILHPFQTFVLFHDVMTIDDSLQSKTEILTYFDPSSLTGEIKEINRAYVKNRIRLKIPKRLILADTPVARQLMAEQSTPFTKAAFIKNFPERHATGMELYDGTVSYVMMKGARRISVIIRDPLIYELHRSHFEFIWSMAQDIVDYAEGIKRSASDSGAGSKTA